MMDHERTYRLGDLQLQIMKVLWHLGPASVAEVHAELGAGTLAYTTVATMLRKMEERGLVTHRQRQRKFFYEAAVDADAVTRSMTGHLVDRLFEGSLSAAVSHLLETRDVSPEELARLEQLIRQRKKQK